MAAGNPDSQKQGTVPEAHLACPPLPARPPAPARPPTHPLTPARPLPQSRPPARAAPPAASSEQRASWPAPPPAAISQGIFLAAAPQQHSAGSPGHRPLLARHTHDCLRRATSPGTSAWPPPQGATESSTRHLRQLGGLQGLCRSRARAWALAVCRAGRGCSWPPGSCCSTCRPGRAGLGEYPPAPQAVAAAPAPAPARLPAPPPAPLPAQPARLPGRPQAPEPSSGAQPAGIQRGQGARSQFLSSSAGGHAGIQVSVW